MGARILMLSRCAEATVEHLLDGGDAHSLALGLGGKKRVAD
jgi:hypothetical protein